MSGGQAQRHLIGPERAELDAEVERHCADRGADPARQVQFQPFQTEKRVNQPLEVTRRWGS